MTQTIEATYENGVFKPETPVAVAEGTKVQLAVTTPFVLRSPLTDAERQRRLARIEEIVALSGVNEDEDGSINHDHYLYGAPKQDKE